MRQKATPDTNDSENNQSVIDRVLRLFSSVRLGIVLLVLLLICCMIGMLVMQQNVTGFDEYYGQLTPSQRELYGMLGLFDIYHSWYFTALLAATALNIVLSSIDRFPAAWIYIRQPKRSASPAFIRAQMFTRLEQSHRKPEALAREIATVWRSRGFRARATRDGERLTLFAQRNLWNRFGAYAVHVSLLVIFAGAFMTSRYGIGGVMEIAPGDSSNTFFTFTNSLDGERSSRAPLPFTVECTDIQQQLVTPEGGLDPMNTIDWLSFVRIKDGDKKTDALVHLNAPFDYRGYRFFQSSFQPRGNARRIAIVFEPGAGRPEVEAEVSRGGSADVPGIGRVDYIDFFPDADFKHDHAVSVSDEYNNPAAELRITSPDGRVSNVYALSAGHDKTSAFPASQESFRVGLKGFEKVAASHTLSVQYDPGRIPVYIGFTLLSISLCAVFFFSHQRVWAVIVPSGDGATLHFGANTNRNRPAFQALFNALATSEIGASR
jgi:cytochrome c biogenesis protein